MLTTIIETYEEFMQQTKSWKVGNVGWSAVSPFLKKYVTLISLHFIK